MCGKPEANMEDEHQFEEDFLLQASDGQVRCSFVRVSAVLRKQPIRTSADKISSPDGTANGMDFVGGEALASSSNSSSTPVWAPKNIAFPSFSTPNRGQRSCRSSKST